MVSGNFAYRRILLRDFHLQAPWNSDPLDDDATNILLAEPSMLVPPFYYDVQLAPTN